MPQANPYMAGERRKADILRVGLAIWRESGEGAVTARAIARRLNISHAGILYHHGTTKALKLALACHAVATGDKTIIPQLITTRNPVVAHFDEPTRVAWLNA